MDPKEESQSGSGVGKPSGSGQPGDELVVPNPKLKLMDQVREVLRIQHDSIRTERCYRDWIRRYVQSHRMRSESFISRWITCKRYERTARLDSAPGA